MAAKQQKKSGNWEYRFTRKGLLSKPVWFTFDTEEEGDAFVRRMEAVLDSGRVPPELSGKGLKLLWELFEKFGETTLSDSDKELIGTLSKAIGTVRIDALNYGWVEQWVVEMQGAGLAPSTLTKRVGLLARCVDWAMRSEMLSMLNNPLRLLPRGYATNGRVAKEASWSGERDRRLEQTEEGAIRKVLAAEEATLFDMA